MKKYLLSLIAVGLMFSMSTASAEDMKPRVKQSVYINSSGHANLFGVVESVGVDSLVVKSWGGPWTVKVTSDTRFTNAKNKLSDFMAHDAVEVKGTMNKDLPFTIIAKHMKNKTKRTKQVNRNDDNDRAIRVTLAQINNSGISGTASLKEDDGKVKVKLELNGALADAVEPAHIHAGACPGVGDVRYPLTSVTNGKSETILNVRLADLKAGLPLAINVHKSATEAGVYVACGEVRL